MSVSEFLTSLSRLTSSSSSAQTPPYYAFTLIPPKIVPIAHKKKSGPLDERAQSLKSFCATSRLAATQNHCKVLAYSPAQNRQIGLETTRSPRWRSSQIVTKRMKEGRGGGEEEGMWWKKRKVGREEHSDRAAGLKFSLRGLVHPEPLFGILGQEHDQHSSYDLPSSGLNTLLIFLHLPCTMN